MYSFKNDFQRHSWGYTGVVETSAWPRAEVRCKICGEVRLIATSLDSPGLRWGCYRTAFQDKLKQGDLILIRDTWRLDRFEAYAPDGSGDLITSNLGGGRYRVAAGTWERYT